MAYEIHIRRLDGERGRLPIPLEAWLAAVQAVPNVRLASGDAVAQNTATSEVIRIRDVGGNVEVIDPARQTWDRALRWSAGGYASFRAPQGFENSDHPMRIVARELAEAVGAVVVGDEGETYP
ncbi:MAG: hypothetical protein ABL901_16615 [Hyphomicrobiaceae bacterium]